MSITVHDILQLDILKDAALVTGKDGLLREVSRVNFTDCPLEGDMGYSLVNKGDLYIRSFYMDYEDEQKLYDIIHFYIQTGSSCCLGMNYYLTEIPERVLSLANKNHYPIIIINENTSYGKLIQDISELIMTEQVDLLSEHKLDRLLYDNLSLNEIYDITSCLISNFPESYFALCFAYPELSSYRFKFLKSDLSSQFNLRLLRYHCGGFIIGDWEKHHNSPQFLDSLTKLLTHYSENLSLGISRQFDKTEPFTSCLKEAKTAQEISRLTENKITCYDNLSVYNLLIPLRNQETTRKLCDKLLTPLKDYGTRHSIDLIETVSIYLQNNGDYKKAASILKTPESTVRFRIDKAMNLLNLEGKTFVFIEQLSIALKAAKLIK